ncbi:uncharacterized protein FOMMEDRAFT_18085 [Fomitiporia mediterranea MF3/22]|uniref:uncharacterized protein n=1 Tax=Fomitiporia mediterranea (strain MF3/22) TaxID=694068 RepID=UPI0004407692|nr:uncharacterized protein FOMMEDRAFT_18085 [Fomitiporia mediterranea MF3/22]EJD05835.1 hypothetical protein FOMMEDRAFT_18085 [Fomitiporia mediterranea MF3/22]
MAPKKRCQLKSDDELVCKAAALRFAGECAHCNQNFCGDHRLPEHHDCNKLEDCRQAAFQRNKDKLEAERTVASKMAVA